MCVYLTIKSVMTNIFSHAIICVKYYKYCEMYSRVLKSRFKFAIILRLYSHGIYTTRERSSRATRVICIPSGSRQARNLNSHIATVSERLFLNVIVCPDFYVDPIKAIILSTFRTSLLTYISFFDFIIVK